MFGPDDRHRHLLFMRREGREARNVAPAPRPDPPSFEALYRAEFDYVWHVLRSLGVAPRDTEDLVHDVFLKVHGVLGRYDPSRPVRPWLFGIAFRVVTNFRRLARHRWEFQDSGGQHRDSDSSAEAVVSAREQIWRGMDGLDAEHRAIFVMHELLGHSMLEAAAALEVPLSTLYERLGRARAHFIERMRRLEEREGG
jgi:RNA polymerase sigma factor (sigma-70 family)